MPAQRAHAFLRLPPRDSAMSKDEKTGKKIVTLDGVPRPTSRWHLRCLKGLVYFLKVNVSDCLRRERRHFAPWRSRSERDKFRADESEKSTFGHTCGYTQGIGPTTAHAGTGPSVGACPLD